MGKCSLRTLLVGEYTSYCVYDHFQLLFLLCELKMFPVSQCSLPPSLPTPPLSHTYTQFQQKRTTVWTTEKSWLTSVVDWKTSVWRDIFNPLGWKIHMVQFRNTMIFQKSSFLLLGVSVHKEWCEAKSSLGIEIKLH